VNPDRSSGAPYGRYRDLGLLGRGSMAEVRRVFDPALDRAVAMKILKPGLLGNGLAQTRFKKEARAIARLQHPAIVPIHDIGLLPDGRPYYTMKVVEGRTLKAVIREVHSGRSEEGWTLRRLVEALHRAAEAVAFAHAHDVLHRDLKPDNIMLGRFGEVLVVDWGLAKVLRDAAPLADPGGVNTADVSQTGSVSGTPAYMAPEQVEHGALTPATDVYALGAMLYEILSGRPPYVGPTAWLVLLQVKTGTPTPLRQAAEAAGAPPVPDELAAVVETAISRQPEDRYPHAGALARDLNAWLDGEARRERALGRLSEADALAPRIAEHRARAEALCAEATRLLAGVPSHAPVSEKKAAWDLQDAAVESDRAAVEAEFRMVRALREVLIEQPDLDEAHTRLADHYQARHAAAEARRDGAAAAEAEANLRVHDRGRHAAWLRGTGSLTLRTDPPGAEARLYRYALRDRRLVPEAAGTLGTTPLLDVPLEMGSWLVELHHPGRLTVRYPVAIGRNERWLDAPADDPSPCPVPLPPADALGPEEIYLPPGRFWFGGDPDIPQPIARELRWTDAWVLARNPVTNAEFLAFLNDLAANGQVQEALRYAPRQRNAGPGDPGGMVLGWDGARFTLQPDAEGDTWEADYPVVLVDWYSACAYARWRAARDGRAWQLLPEVVWEKGARGVDGRSRPWGETMEPTWCCMKDSQPRPLPSVVSGFPMDESPFGMRHVAGNARSWCADRFRPELADASTPDSALPRVVRGGCWLDGPRGSRVTVRDTLLPIFRNDILGFRLGWPYTR